jgi:hypothetical protein
MLKFMDILSSIGGPSRSPFLQTLVLSAVPCPMSSLDTTAMFC